MAVQQEYRPVVDAAFALCANRFDSRLDAVYVAGSVAAGEAWPGESDIDWFMFLRDEATPDDKSWCERNGNTLASQYPVAKEFHLNVYPTDFLRTETSLIKFILRYNSLCLSGFHHLEMIERTGVTIEKPSAKLAKRRLGFVRRCVDGLAQRHVPEGLFGSAIPADLSTLTSSDYLASRKLVRHFVLLEGAYLLMLTGDFRSFRKDEVLPSLVSVYPVWKDVIAMTTAILDDPLAARVSPDRAIDACLPFAQWAIKTTESA